MKKMGEWLREKGQKVKDLKKDQLLIFILAGVLLLIIALPVNSSEKKEENQKEGGLSAFSGNQESSQERRAESSTEQQSSRAYAEELEQKLELILENMEWVGKAQVVITFQSSEERVVEKDIPVTRSNTEETDSQGGSRRVNNVDTKESTIYETDSGSSTPYVVKTINPQVEGVLVVCEGAGTGSVSKNITEAIEVLFGIEPHKIKVVKMKTS